MTFSTNNFIYATYIEKEKKKKIKLSAENNKDKSIRRE